MRTLFVCIAVCTGYQILAVLGGLLVLLVDRDLGPALGFILFQSTIYLCVPVSSFYLDTGPKESRYGEPTYLDRVSFSLVMFGMIVVAFLPAGILGRVIAGVWYLIVGLSLIRLLRRITRGVDRSVNEGPSRLT